MNEETLFLSVRSSLRNTACLYDLNLHHQMYYLCDTSRSIFECASSIMEVKTELVVFKYSQADAIVVSSLLLSHRYYQDFISKHSHHARVA